MPAPTAATYPAATLVAAHTAVKALIDAGAGAGYVRLRDAADVLLAQAPLADPCGTVDAGTGRLTLSPAGPAVPSGPLGTVAYAQICDSSSNIIAALPAQQGPAPVPGFVVMTSLTLVDSGPIAVTSITIG